jgi:DNA-binding CsgD family transcriptional regulator
MHKDRRDAIDYSAVFAASPIATCVSRDRIILSCNAAAASLFNCPLNMMIGNSYELLYPSNAEFKRFGLQVNEALGTDGVYLGERIMKRCEGELFWCRVHGVALEPDYGISKEIWTFTEVVPRSKVYKVLSPREREVATFLLTGNTSKMIAEKIGLSPRTVEFYRRGLMQKLSANSFSDLVKLLTE